MSQWACFEGTRPMDSERELKCLVAIWALSGVLTPKGFRDFKLQDGLVGWDKEELVDYLKSFDWFVKAY
jgi:hypothetical protein